MSFQQKEGLVVGKDVTENTMIMMMIAVILKMIIYQPQREIDQEVEVSVVIYSFQIDSGSKNNSNYFYPSSKINL